MTNQILELWQRILADNILPLGSFYNALTEPIAFLIGVPLCIALCGVLISFFGGKRK